MVDRRRDIVTHRSQHNSAPHSVNASPGWGDYHQASPLTASAQMLPHSEYRYAATALVYDTWQEEAWAFYESLGEFNYAIEWFSDALSRVRLIAAETAPLGDEPVPLKKGTATDLVARMGGGTDMQAQLMRSFAVQLSVPGDCYFVGREVTEPELYGDTALDSVPDEEGRVWSVQSVNTLRRSQRTMKTVLGRRRRGWQLQTDETTWLDLPRESLVTRVWDRDEHFPWRALSAAKAALPIMREIDMYNRYIMATLLSRVALNGLLLIPDEVTLPVNPAYAQAAEPFMSELIDIMRTTIKNPGSPSSAAPVPVRGPGEHLEKIKHVSFATSMDEKVFEARRDAITRLASSLNVPLEIITGMGQSNHWNAWEITEDAIKTHIEPLVEIILRCLTTGYLHPMLRALGEPIRTPDGSDIVIWYDASTLTQRPDRSDLAVKLRDMLIINDSAARRETGFTEDDAPTDDELEKMILMKLAVNPQTYSAALRELTGLDLGPPPGTVVPGGEATPGGDSSSDSGPEEEESPPAGVGNEPEREPPKTRDESGNGTVTASAVATRRADLVRRVTNTQGDARVGAVAALVTHDYATGTLPSRLHQALIGGGDGNTG